MLRLARPACDGSSDLSFAEPSSKKWKPDRSCLTELGEGKLSTCCRLAELSEADSVCRCTDDEEFDNWEIPEEPSDDMEMSTNSVSVRSFEER